MDIGRKTKTDQGRAGLTLVELMIVIGLSGLISLGLSSLLTLSAKQSVDAQRAAELEEEIDLFEFKLRTFFLGMVRVRSCYCGGVPGNCGWNGLESGGSNTLLEADFEVDSDVFDGNVAPCSVAEGQRGCKQAYTLAYSASTPQTTEPSGFARVGAPGILSIRQPDGTSIAQLNGVTSVQCGFPLGSSGPDPHSFRLVIGAKARTTSLMVGDPATLQGWNAADPGFSQGILRWAPLQLEALSMNHRGLIVSGIQTKSGCVADGAVAPVGNCCSGFQDFTSRKCLASSRCGRTGSASSQAAGLLGAAVGCCSHQDTREGTCARTSTLVQ